MPPRALLLLFALTACSDGGGAKPGGGGGGSGDDTGAPSDTGAPDAADPVAALGLLPVPASLALAEGSVALDETTVLWATGPGLEVAELLAEALAPATGLPLPVQEGDGTGAGPADVVLRIDDSVSESAEGYRIVVDPEAGIQLTGADRDGLFWSTQTLRQLLPAAAFSPSLATPAGDAWAVPALTIDDAPTHSWRGGMLDVARHFYGVDFVKRQIDLFALHKLNRFHLHLTDDQGWRIEIQSWPELAIIGGATEVGGGPGGYYTQDEYVELVEYAAARSIVIIPEIDFPGHANAALSAYGVLNESGEPAAPYTGTPVITTPLYLGAPETYEMVEDVWTEVAALTPGPWVHVGGDEAIDLDQPEYAAFMQWLHGVIEDQDKLLIGWDEIGEGELSRPHIAQYWWQGELAVAAADAGAELIYSWASECYLDMVYDGEAEFGQTWAGRIDTRKAYTCRPGLGGVDNDRWLGIEGPLWTEFVGTEDDVEFMLWPRLSAMSESAWSSGPLLDWDDFAARAPQHGARLAAIGVAFNRDDTIDWDAATP